MHRYHRTSRFLDLFYDLPEVESEYCIGYGQREEPRSPCERPEEEFPEVEPLPADNPQEQDRFEERPDIPPLEMEFPQRQRPVLPEEPDQSLILVFR
jgi:hypothetical protein